MPTKRRSGVAARASKPEEEEAADVASPSQQPSTPHGATSLPKSSPRKRIRKQTAEEDEYDIGDFVVPPDKDEPAPERKKRARRQTAKKKASDQEEEGGAAAGEEKAHEEDEKPHTVIEKSKSANATVRQSC